MTTTGLDGRIWKIWKVKGHREVVSQKGTARYHIRGGKCMTGIYGHETSKR
jgi:hypothetical protein